MESWLAEWGAAEWSALVAGVFAAISAAAAVIANIRAGKANWIATEALEWQRRLHLRLMPTGQFGVKRDGQPAGVVAIGVRVINKSAFDIFLTAVWVEYPGQPSKQICPSDNHRIERGALEVFWSPWPKLSPNVVLDETPGFQVVLTTGETFTLSNTDVLQYITREMPKPQTLSAAAGSP